MKPKERYLNYALLSTATHHHNQSPPPFTKQDIPIDLSMKRPNSGTNGHLGLFHNHYDHHTAPFSHSPPHPSEPWPTTKYCFPNLVSKQYGFNGTASSAILPYLFINPTCLPPEHEKRLLHHHNRHHAVDHSVYDHPFALPPGYRLPIQDDPLIVPFKLDVPYGHGGPIFGRHSDRQSDSDQPPPSSSESSSSTASSPYDHNHHHILHHNHHQESQTIVDHRTTTSQPMTKNSSSTINGSQLSIAIASGKLRKASSQPNLFGLIIASPLSTLRRSKSEQNLHLIKSFDNSPKICAPKKMFASNYSKESAKENGNKEKPLTVTTTTTSPTRPTANTRFYRNYRKEAIECWDQENNKDNKRPVDDALDLRTNNISLHKLPNELEKNPDSSEFENIHSYSGDYLHDLKHPVALPLDIYRQYYYYLIQEPAFASRAAVAVAETYAKLIHSSNKTDIDSKNGHSYNQSTSPENGHREAFSNREYETKRSSPDFIVSGSRAELRSADTTNGMSFDRKRISRPLTGKHVRHGTGASPSTLVSLRNMIQQRQKLKEFSNKFDGNNRFKGKSNKRIKRK
ncbi:hypothetical protein BLOT_001822 [Blomia tropicalis]|nr:hypothetical protein BLOT_001822 [Blomia tropicalis]